MVLETDKPILEELLGPERRSAVQTTRFEQLLDELEEQAGQVPLREVGRRAAMEAERNTIERVLHQTGWNRKKAAELLCVSYKTLLLKIRECGLEPE